jgi:hypothetical protein
VTRKEYIKPKLTVLDLKETKAPKFPVEGEAEIEGNTMAS